MRCNKPKKSYAYLLNEELNVNLVFSKTYSTYFDETIIKLSDQIGRNRRKS